ncbi:Phytosulfokines 5 [Hordeum vulgare]|nr:Phytosulfokines 5 [Hordeum vulgare]
MSGLPPKEEKEVSGDEDNSGDEQIQFDPYCVFNRYYYDKDNKGARKDKGQRLMRDVRLHPTSWLQPG